MTTTAITNAALLTLDEDGTIVEPGDLVIEGPRIAYVGPPGGYEGTPDATLDGTGMVAMPGFANCHTHSYSGLLKGTVDAEPLDLFMVSALLGAGARTERDVYLSAKVSALEMLLTGTTACLDHYSHRPGHTAEALDAVARAYADAGVRAAIAPMFSDLPFVDTIPLKGELGDDVMEILPRVRQPTEPYFEMMGEALARWGGHDTVTLMLGIDSPQRCTDVLLTEAGTFCADHGIGNHTHLLEAKTQWAMAKGRAPNGFVRFLAERGLAGEKSSFAHFIWFTDEDVEAAAQTGVHVVHNPASNLILGSGLQPLLALLDAGVNVAFGSDGLNAGHMSMFEKVRLAALLPRVCETDPTRWITAGDALRTATVGGAALLGRGGEAGVLAAGQLADIVLLDGRTVALSPRGSLAPQLLYNETGASVRHVFVGGEQVVKDGAPTRFDAADILGEASEAAARLAAESAETLRTVEAFRPGITRMVRRVLECADGPCRMARLS